jgi:hypothetical protein
MGFNKVLKNSYRLVTAMIVAGFVMLCQPLSQTLFSTGFPVLMIGVIGFMILDHIPEKQISEEVN